MEQLIIKYLMLELKTHNAENYIQMSCGDRVIGNYEIIKHIRSIFNVEITSQEIYNALTKNKLSWLRRN